MILYGLGLVSAGLAVLVWFCMVFCWSVVAALSLFNSVWSWVGFSWPRCVCLVVYFGLVSASLATFVWFYVGGWGVCPNREILMGPACVIPSLGLWTSISPLAGVPCPWGWCLSLLRNESKSGSVRSWMIPGGSWMSSGVYQLGFLSFSKDF